jgi:DUF971 family protein
MTTECLRELGKAGIAGGTAGGFERAGSTVDVDPDRQGGRAEAVAVARDRVDLHQASRVLEVGFDDGQAFRLPFELLRVYSPSAEVQGHGPGQEVLQTGKREVGIDALDSVGHYAVQPHFSDGHDTGIFSWEYLYFLGSQQADLWRQYEERLRTAGVDRDAPMSVASGAGACGHSH